MINISLSNTYKVAILEFGKIVRHPLVIVIFSVLLLISILNGVGGAKVLPLNECNYPVNDIVTSIALSMVFYYTSLFCTIIAIFIGLFSIVDERASGSLNIMLTKPVYRRDILIGKICGISIFLIIFIMINVLLSSLFIFIFYRWPYSIDDFSLRFFSYVTIISIECILSCLVAILIGLIIKNQTAAIMGVITFLFIDWYVIISKYVGELKILSPRYNLFISINNSNINLLDTSIGYFVWLKNAMPLISFMLLEIMLLILINAWLFTRENESKLG